jgi:hypothetical protein
MEGTFQIWEVAKMVLRDAQVTLGDTAQMTALRFMFGP